MAQENNINIPADVLMLAVNNLENDVDIRTQALSYLVKYNAPDIQDVLQKLSFDASATMRSQALTSLFANNKTMAFKHIDRFLNSEDITDKQTAYKVLATSSGDKINKITLAAVDNLNKTKKADGATLELIDLAEKSDNPDVKSALNSYKTRLKSGNVMTKYAASLYGGNANKGEQIFSGGGATECMRCHIVNWKGGNVGPELSNIANERSREYLLQSIVDVQAVIAPGYGTVAVLLNNGNTLSGIYQGETSTTITLENQNNDIQLVAKSDIKSMQRPISGMPPMNLLMNDYQIRDMVAYLAKLKRDWEKVEEIH